MISTKLLIHSLTTDDDLPYGWSNKCGRTIGTAAVVFVFFLLLPTSQPALSSSVLISNRLAFANPQKVMKAMCCGFTQSQRMDRFCVTVGFGKSVSLMNHKQFVSLTPLGCCHFLLLAFPRL